MKHLVSKAFYLKKNGQIEEAISLSENVIKRFDDALKDTKKAVVEKNNELNRSNKEVNDKTRNAILKNVAKHDFYNTSKFDFAGLIADADNIKENFKRGIR